MGRAPAEGTRPLVNESVAVFGFGSYFSGNADPEDIDLLLLHQATERSSCLLAIECKAYLQRILVDADVVMLSRSEAEENQFLARSGAIALGTLHPGDLEMQVRALARQITSRRP